VQRFLLNEPKLLYKIQEIRRNAMQNYKECRKDVFDEAMKQKDEDVSRISDENLYILYTKFRADARQAFSFGSTYASGIGRQSQRKADAYKAELLRRGRQLWRDVKGGLKNDN
jgi:hypothetical protein